MFILETRIESLTTFKRQTADMLLKLHETGNPLVLTVNGKAEVVMQDAAAYQRFVERVAEVEREETLTAIREGLADVEAGRTKPARQALRALAKKFGLATSDH